MHLYFFSLPFVLDFKILYLFHFFSKTIFNLGGQITGAQNRDIDLQITIE